MINLYSYFPELSAEQLFTACSSYFDANRHYHNIDHILHMLNLYDEHKDKLFAKDDRKAYLLRYAILYHDVVYNVDSSENEISSALLFLADTNTSKMTAKADPNEVLLSKLGAKFGMPAPAQVKKSLFTQKEKDFVYRMIMVTSDHIGQREFYKGSEDEKYAGFMADLDLASIGADWETFQTNNANLYNENNTSENSSSRNFLMNDFLERLQEGQIFVLLTDYEKVAKDNLEKYFNGE